MRNLQKERLADITKRFAYSPAAVYRHRQHGWEYLPVHPFADEPHELERLNISPASCVRADAWCIVNGDATLLEIDSSLSGLTCDPGLYARQTHNSLGWVYLQAVIEPEPVTRPAVENAISRFVELGFPDASRFTIRPEAGSVRIGDLAF